MEAPGLAAESGGGGVHEPDGGAARGLVQGEYHAGLSVLAALVHRRSRRRIGGSGENLLMFGQGLRRVGLAPQPLVKPAELVMHGGMPGLELRERLELAHGLVVLAEPLGSEAELEVERADRSVDLLGLLKGLDRLLQLVEPHPGASHQVMGGGIIVIEAEGLLGLFDHLGGVASEQTGVGQVQTRVNAFRRELDRLLVGGDGFPGVALFEVTLAQRHRPIEPVRTVPGADEDEHEGGHHGDPKTNPEHLSFHKARVRADGRGRQECPRSEECEVRAMRGLYKLS